MTDNITNLATYDPFADTGNTDEKLTIQGYIRMQIQFIFRYSYSTKKWKKNYYYPPRIASRVGPEKDFESI